MNASSRNGEVTPPTLVVFLGVRLLLFQSIGQFLSWLTGMIVAFGVGALLETGPHLIAWMVGSILFSPYYLIRCLPYELQVNTAHPSPYLARIRVFLLRNRCIPVAQFRSAQGLPISNDKFADSSDETWTPKPSWHYPVWLNWWLRWKEADIHITCSEACIIVRGPSVTMKSLWRDLLK